MHTKNFQGGPAILSSSYRFLQPNFDRTFVQGFLVPAPCSRCTVCPEEPQNCPGPGWRRTGGSTMLSDGLVHGVRGHHSPVGRISTEPWPRVPSGRRGLWWKDWLIETGHLSLCPFGWLGCPPQPHAPGRWMRRDRFAWKSSPPAGRAGQGRAARRSDQAGHRGRGLAVLLPFSLWCRFLTELGISSEPRPSSRGWSPVHAVRALEWIIQTAGRIWNKRNLSPDPMKQSRIYDFVNCPFNLRQKYSKMCIPIQKEEIEGKRDGDGTITCTSTHSWVSSFAENLWLLNF